MTLPLQRRDAASLRSSSDIADQILTASRARQVLDCSNGNRRGTIEAEDLRRACLASNVEGDPYGIRIANAAITGPLDLRAAVMSSPLHFVSCRFTDAPQLDGANLFELSITDNRHASTEAPMAVGRSYLPGLLANGIQIRRDFILSGTVITGAHPNSASLSRTSAVWMNEAQIGGRLLAVGTRIYAKGDRAIQCDRTQVAGDVRLVQGFFADRELRLLAMQLKGSLDLTGASLRPQNGRALDLGEAFIGGSLFILEDPATSIRPRIEGRIEAGSAVIQGRVLIRNACLKAPPAGAGGHDYNAGESSTRTLILAPRLSVGGEFAIEGRTCMEGAIRLAGAELRGGFRMGPSGSKPQRPHIHNSDDDALDVSQGILGAALDLRAIAIQGTVNLANAQINGPVDLRGASVTAPNTQRCVVAVRSRIDGDVRMNEFTATGGSVNFRGASIGGVVDAEAASLSNAGDKTLSLHQADVAGNVRLCRGFTSTGLVVLNRAVIQGRLRCDGATLAWKEAPPNASASESNSRGSAFEAISTVVRSGIGLGWTITAGAVDLTDAQTSYLADNAAADWPDDSYLAGFVYERFGPLDMRSEQGIWDAGTRSRWLARIQPDEPHAWEQLARVLRANGDRVGAEDVLIAQRRCARKQGATFRRRPLRRLVDAVQEWFVGYGHRPQRSLGILIVLIAAVALTLYIPAARASMRATDAAIVVSPDSTVVHARQGPCDAGRIRCLSPVLYAIDTVVPIVDLDQRNTWYPTAGADGTAMAWWLDIATILGWITSTVFALSFARIGRTTSS
jgi:hypothetical protein